MSQLPESIKEIIRRELAPQQPCLEGWTSAERGIEMAELVINTIPRCVVEIGVFGGRSLIAQGLALKHITVGQIYGIDSWKKEDTIEGESTPENIDWWSKVDIHRIHRGCMEAMWRLGLDEQIVIVRSASQNCGNLFKHQKIDILNIDSNHSEKASCRDVMYWLPSVKSGGHIWMDDCDWPSTKKAQAMLEQQCDTIKVSPDGHYKLYHKR